MIAVDTNILVYSHRVDSPWHEKALGCIRKLSEGTDRWCIPWSCLHEFYSVVTHPRIYSPPTPIETALNAMESFISSPTVVLIGEQPDHFTTLKELIIRAKCSGPMVHDARIAAVCIGANIDELWTADRDFSRFPGLTTRNPLI